MEDDLPEDLATFDDSEDAVTYHFIITLEYVLGNKPLRITREDCVETIGDSTELDLFAYIYDTAHTAAGEYNPALKTAGGPVVLFYRVVRNDATISNTA